PKCRSAEEGEAEADDAENEFDAVLGHAAFPSSVLRRRIACTASSGAPYSFATSAAASAVLFWVVSASLLRIASISSSAITPPHACAGRGRDRSRRRRCCAPRLPRCR